MGWEWVRKRKKKEEEEEEERGEEGRGVERNRGQFS